MSRKKTNEAVLNAASNRNELTWCVVTCSCLFVLHPKQSTGAIGVQSRHRYMSASFGTCSRQSTHRACEKCGHTHQAHVTTHTMAQININPNNQQCEQEQGHASASVLEQEQAHAPASVLEQEQGHASASVMEQEQAHASASVLEQEQAHASGTTGQQCSHSNHLWWWWCT